MVAGENAASLGLTGREVFEIAGVASGIESTKQVAVRARRESGREDGKDVSFTAKVRIDTPEEVLYYKHGGILPYVLRQLL